MAIAEELSRTITEGLRATSVKDKIEKVEAKRPGFINFYVSAEALYDVLEQIFAQKDDFGRLEFGRREKVLLEFVSANPTGPLSVAHARQAAVGDALANILAFVGFDVKKEYYVNDEGNQIDILGQSIACRCREALGEKVTFPEDGYQGEYVREMASEFLAKHKIKDPAGLDKIKKEQFCQFGVDHLMEVIKKDLKDFGVHFDVWSHQSKLATPKHTEEALALLQKEKFIYEKDGALWFRSTEFGDDKDRVVKKSNGLHTYLAPDIAYHRNKFDRGFHTLINIWGPDHHGYISRLKAAVAALGHSADQLKVLIVQLATIYRKGKPVSMSTRRGEFISLKEVMDEVGVDAARFFFLLRHINAHLEFDLELAKQQTPENPVYYIQYAHARIYSIVAKAKESDIYQAKGRLKLLNTPEEHDLIKKMGAFPDILMVCHQQMDPYPVLSYLMELATVFHKFYDQHRVADPENKELSQERLALIDAVRIVIANGLRLLGVSRPEKM